MSGTPLSPLPPFPKTGISLLLLQKLRHHILLSSPLYDHWTTDDVCKQLILPWTANEKCSFVTLLERYHQTIPHPILGITFSEVCHPKAHIFISHAWKYKFLDVVAALETYYQTNTSNHRIENTFLWFDLVVNDQWGAVILPQIWWKTVFMEAIESIGHTLMITIPWKDPITLTRAWCLWELYCTRASHSLLTLQLNEMEMNEFYREVRADSGIVYSSLCEINVEKSQAYKPDDREMIFDAVRSLDGGFHSVNIQVKDLLRDWVKNSAREMAGRLLCLDPSSDSDQLSTSSFDLLIELSPEEIQNSQSAAVVLMNQGHLLQAHQIFENIIKYHENELSSEHPLQISSFSLSATSHSIHSPLIHTSLLTARANLALCLHRQGLLQESKSLYEQLLHEDSESVTILSPPFNHNHNHFPNPPEYLVCLNGYANLLHTLHHDTKALEIYERIIDQSEDLNGSNTPLILDVLNNKAVILKQSGHYDQAIEIFLVTLKRKEMVYGTHHPSTIDTISNLATCYKRVEQYLKAEEMYLSALQGYESTLGETHLTTLDIVNNLAILYKVMKLYPQAEKFYLRALQGYEIVFGDKNSHESYLRTCSNFGLLLLELKRYEEAERYLLKVYEKYCERDQFATETEIARETSTKSTLDVMLNLAYLYSKQRHQYPKAKDLYESLYIKYSLLSPTDPFSFLRYLKLYADFLLVLSSSLSSPLQCALTSSQTDAFSRAMELYTECFEGYMKHYGLDAIITQQFLSHYLIYLMTKHSVEVAYEFVEGLYASNDDIFHTYQQQEQERQQEVRKTSILGTMISFLENGRVISSLPMVCSAEEMGVEAIHCHDLTRKDVLYSNGLYNCDSCQGDGCGWGYCCSLCQEDFHPLCAFGRNMRGEEGIAYRKFP
jgi:tetratricopeptide (TPR) repeat protein